MVGQAERLVELKKYFGGSTGGSASGIIAFTSGKGGTGKTFLSLNTAYTLAKQNRKVLFIDMDSNLSNANIMLNHVPDRTIFEYYAGKKLLHEVITEYEPNLHFIFGDSGRTDYPEFMSDVISRLFKQLRQMEKKYDLIIVDTGAGANKAVIDILLNADANVVVTSPEPTAVMDAYVIIKLLNHNRYKGKKFVIVNKCGGREKGEETFDNLNTAVLHFLKEKLELIGTVDYDPSVNKSIINQQLFVKSHPVHPVSGSLARVSKALHEYVHLANIHHSRRS